MTQTDTTAFEALVLAAGRSARFGGRKLLAPLDGEPLIAGALATAFRSPVRRVIVALGPDPDLREAIEGTAARLAVSERLELIEIADPRAGMGASLAAVAAAAADDAAGVFVFLGDMPRVDPATPERLARVLVGPSDIVTPTYHGRRGHPVLFGGAWLPALRGLSGDEGARALLESAGARLARIPVEDPGIHLDVDRPEDLARAAKSR